jgi:ABC-type antimicrobial peptide transport system permease subunit
MAPNKTELEAIERPKNPDVLALENLQKLTTKPNEVLTDLTHIEIAALSLYKAFNENHVKIPSVMGFFDNLQAFRASLLRQGRKEVIEGFKGMRPQYVIPGFGASEKGEESNKKSGFLSFLMGGNSK